jgi:hypothetical protein
MPNCSGSSEGNELERTKSDEEEEKLRQSTTSKYQARNSSLDWQEQSVGIPFCPKSALQLADAFRGNSVLEQVRFG